MPDRPRLGDHASRRSLGWCPQRSAPRSCSRPRDRPGDDPWPGDVSSAEVLVRLVLRVTKPVIVETHAERRVMYAHAIPARRALIDVIAEVDDEIGILERHVLVRGVEPLLVMLAGREEQPQRRRGARRRQRAEPAGLARRVSGMKAIEIPAVGLEAAHVYVDA